jgi:hypothetical protein
MWTHQTPHAPMYCLFVPGFARSLRLSAPLRQPAPEPPRERMRAAIVLSQMAASAFVNVDGRSGTLQRFAIYIVISIPKRNSVALGVSQRRVIADISMLVDIALYARSLSLTRC